MPGTRDERSVKNATPSPRARTVLGGLRSPGVSSARPPWYVDDVTNVKEQRPGHAKQGCEGWQDIPDPADLI